jgi:A/G-specific adenine glycosylase
MNSAQFRKIVYDHYKKHGRKLPWRFRSSTSGSRTSEFYKILVSEILLQQTQVDRVIPKYEAFLKKFPTMRTLARAELAEVLRAWQGLGYNRRALWLHEAAKKLLKMEYEVRPPQTEVKPRILVELQKLKGIGPNTAASICAFAYNMPVVFIETNIRTVFLKHFFPYEQQVHDRDILELVKKTRDTKNPRVWYWALMDYGSYLKRTQGNLNRTQSRHYAKQSKFHGSERQLRGMVLKEILQTKKTSRACIAKKFSHDSRFEKVYATLAKEGFIRG